MCAACPLCARPSFAPLCRDRLKPPIGRFALPPLRRTYQAPIGAALPRRYARSSLRFASLGIRDARAPSTRHRLRPLASRCAARDRPGFGHGTAAHAAVPRPAHGAGQPRPPSSRHTSWSGSTAGLGWNSLTFVRSPLPRPRASATDRRGSPRFQRGSSRRSAALLFSRPRSVSGGFGWGRAQNEIILRLQWFETPLPPSYDNENSLLNIHLWRRLKQLSR